MKFIAAVVAFAAVALAYPSGDVAPVKRQNIVTGVDVQIPSMTNRNGDVLPFNSQGVYLDAKAKGL